MVVERILSESDRAKLREETERKKKLEELEIRVKALEDAQ